MADSSLDHDQLRAECQVCTQYGYTGLLTYMYVLVVNRLYGRAPCLYNVNDMFCFTSERRLLLEILNLFETCIYMYVYEVNTLFNPET